MLNIQKFPLETIPQIEAYLKTLHSALNKDARLVLGFGSDCSYRQAGQVKYIINNFDKWYDKERRHQDVYITINQFNCYMRTSKNGQDDPDYKSKIKEAIKGERNSKYLFSLDSLMFDIDAIGENLQGAENLFIDALINAMLINGFPLPNAFSYSGSGGIHLYYTFYSIPDSAKLKTIQRS